MKSFIGGLVGSVVGIALVALVLYGVHTHAKKGCDKPGCCPVVKCDCGCDCCKDGCACTSKKPCCDKCKCDKVCKPGCCEKKVCPCGADCCACVDCKCSENKKCCDECKCAECLKKTGNRPGQGCK